LSQKTDSKQKQEAKAMKDAMNKLAKKMMTRTHKAVKRYQQALDKNQNLPPAQKNMLYGKYLLDIDDAL
jgi:thiaminase